ncbi:cytochrome c biogenesis protein CcdA [Helicobacter cetorum]|uniref:cytochrome c biogenesis protein CcdA n=1 Tax=Helicobacter cetorum TaxID=138563 RepID=UPI000CF1BF6F|nr:cytochrome c biogenesis protein CcdA [Helicobacter cetorum]
MFDNTLIDLFETTPFLTSLLAGVLTFLSPCVLPLIPAYMSYISQISLEDIKDGKAKRVSVFLKSLMFVIGFSLVFLGVGMSMAKLIHSFVGGWVNYISGGIVLLFGLHFLGLFRFAFLYKTQSVRFTSKSNGMQRFYPFLLGVSFALGWTPCIGPIFTSIVMMSASKDTYGFLLMVVYVMGLAIPFLLVALMVERALLFLKSLKKYNRMIEIISGLVLVLMGVLIMTDSMKSLTNFLQN